MVKRWTLGALLAAIGVTSCTIYALSDEVHQERCTWELKPSNNTRYDACDALNIRTDPNFDRCNNWRCGDDHYCEIGLVDFDRDGYSPAACLPAGAQGDCDDNDPAVHPNAEEVCDGRDNDCDRSTDEGMLQITERVAMTFDDEVRELAFAWNDVTDDVGVVSRAASDDAVSFGIVSGTDTAQSHPVLLSSAASPFHASAVNLTARSGSFVVVAIESNPTHRIFVGNVADGTDRAIFSVDEPSQRQTGLRCASDEACATAQGAPVDDLPDGSNPAPQPGPAPTIPESTRPEISVLGDQLLTGYARRLDPAADGCDVQTPAPSLLLNVLEPRIEGYAELTRDAIRLDTSSELRSPQLLAIDAGLVTASREPFGWLAAYLSENAELVIRRVTPNIDQPLGDLELRLPGDAGPYLEAQLVRGSIEDNRVSIGVAARLGCGDQSRIAFGLLQLTWDDTGRNELRVYRDMREIGEPVDPSARLVLAYNRIQSVWAVAYAASDGLFAQVLDRNGEPIGATAYRLGDAPSPGTDLAIVAGGNVAASLFTVFSYAEQPDQSPSHVLIARELQTCPAPRTQVRGN